MASGDGKRSPFSPDGRSGAIGNGEAGAMPGIKDHKGPSPRQQTGSDRNASSVSKGGPFLKVDAPGGQGGRQGQIGTTADPGQRRPFRIDGEGGKDGEDGDGQGPGVVGEVPPEEDEQP